jgi:hypothetical protein
MTPQRAGRRGADALVPSRQGRSGGRGWYTHSFCRLNVHTLSVSIISIQTMLGVVDSLVDEPRLVLEVLLPLALYGRAVIHGVRAPRWYAAADRGSQPCTGTVQSTHQPRRAVTKHACSVTTLRDGCYPRSEAMSLTHSARHRGEVAQPLVPYAQDLFSRY